MLQTIKPYCYIFFLASARFCFLHAIVIQRNNRQPHLLFHKLHNAFGENINLQGSNKLKGNESFF